MATHSLDCATLGKDSEEGVKKGIYAGSKVTLRSQERWPGSFSYLEDTYCTAMPIVPLTDTLLSVLPKILKHRSFFSNPFDLVSVLCIESMAEFPSLCAALKSISTVATDPLQFFNVFVL